MDRFPNFIFNRVFQLTQSGLVYRKNFPATHAGMVVGQILAILPEACTDTGSGGSRTTLKKLLEGLDPIVQYLHSVKDAQSYVGIPPPKSHLLPKAELIEAVKVALGEHENPSSTRATASSSATATAGHAASTNGGKSTTKPGRSSQHGRRRQSQQLPTAPGRNGLT